jgi:hypothetical protein
MNLDEIKYAQRQRLIFLDGCLVWRGSANRRDLMDRFSISSAQAAIDFRIYLQLASFPPAYDAARKTYIASVRHQPLQPTNLVSDFSILNSLDEVDGLTVPQPNRNADPSIISKLYQAKRSGRAIAVRYTSMTSGGGEEQWLVPTGFTSDGENVHLRAYSLKHQEYRDYLPIRIDEGSSFLEKELPLVLPEDVDWNARAKMWLRPSSELTAKQAAVVRREYGFTGDFLYLEIRKALEFYVRRRWRLGDKASRLELAKLEYDEWPEAPSKPD